MPQQWDNNLFSDPNGRSVGATAQSCYWNRLSYSPFSEAVNTGSFFVDLVLSVCPDPPPFIPIPADRSVPRLVCRHVCCHWQDSNECSCVLCIANATCAAELPRPPLLACLFVRAGRSAAATGLLRPCSAGLYAHVVSPPWLEGPCLDACVLCSCCACWARFAPAGLAPLAGQSSSGLRGVPGQGTGTRTVPAVERRPRWSAAPVTAGL